LCTPAVARSGVEVVGAVERDPAGEPDVLLVKGHTTRTGDEVAQKRVDDLVVKMAATAFPDPADATAASVWLRSVLPTAGEAVDVTTRIGGLDIRFENLVPGGYLVHVEAPDG
jgi:hypothetical protein